jgi:hypothetical protein
MVLVDTGSEDETRRLAEERGARVFEAEWNDDFAAARNVALEQAAGQWILVLDADEWIEGGIEPERFRRLLDQASAECFAIALNDHLDTDQRRRYPLVRLFRNQPEYRYEGAFHEQITPSIAHALGRERIEPPLCGLQVGHDGYRREKREERNKAERNLRMLRRRVDSDPSDPAGRYFLIRELVPMRGGRAVPGVHLSEALEHCEWLAPWKGRLSPALGADFDRLHAAALLAEGRPSEALRCLNGDGNGVPALELLRADAELALSGDDVSWADRALRRLRGCFDREGSGVLPCEEPELSGPVARAHAAEVLVRLGRLDDARELAREASRMEGGGAAPWNAVATAERAAGEPAAALRAYLDGVKVDPYDPWGWAGIGEVVLQSGAAADAVEPLCNATALAPGWSSSEEALAAAMLIAGQDGDLRARLESARPPLGAAREAALLLATAAAGEPLLSEHIEREAQQSVRKILRRLAAAGRPDLLKKVSGTFSSAG